MSTDLTSANEPRLTQHDLQCSGRNKLFPPKSSITREDLALGRVCAEHLPSLSDRNRSSPVRPVTVCEEIVGTHSSGTNGLRGHGAGGRFCSYTLNAQHCSLPEAVYITLKMPRQISPSSPSRTNYLRLSSFLHHLFVLKAPSFIPLPCATLLARQLLPP
jgi:hypothetical protein